MKTFKLFENTDVFITLDDNIYGIHSKRVNILYISNISANVHKKSQSFIIRIGHKCAICSYMFRRITAIGQILLMGLRTYGFTTHFFFITKTRLFKYI